MRTYFTVIRTSAGRVVSEQTKAWSRADFRHAVDFAAYDAIKGQGLLDTRAGHDFAARCKIMARGCDVAAEAARQIGGAWQGAPLKEHLTDGAAVTVAFERR